MSGAIKTPRDLHTQVLCADTFTSETAQPDQVPTHMVNRLHLYIKS